MHWLMSQRWGRLVFAVFALCVLLVVVVVAMKLGQQQVADSNFDAKVARPAYRDTHPKVLFDESHNNFQTTKGGYKPFVELSSIIFQYDALLTINNSTAMHVRQ